MRRGGGTFQSLSNRNFRLYFIGQSISVSGTWMQKVAQAWLVLELSGSGTLLGVTLALQHLPLLVIGPWGGLLADRFDKRKILLRTQCVSAGLALLLGVLTVTGLVQLWLVLVLAFALGTAHALDKPARHTFVLEMVKPEHLTNAVTLTSIVANAGKSVGPAIAGVLIASVGLGVSFMLNAVSYIAVVVSLALMREDDLARALPAAYARGQLREGVRYVRSTPELLGPLGLMTVAGLLAYEWGVTLPLMARDAVGGDAQTFGLMFSAMGIGAVLGGLVVAGSLKATTGVLLTTAWVFSVLIGAAAVAPTVGVLLVALVFLGGASIALKAVASSLVQLRSAPEMRGRVTALLAVATSGTTPVGGPLVGWISETWGPRFALGLGGAATAVAAAATVVYLRRCDDRKAREAATAPRDTASVNTNQAQPGAGRLVQPPPNRIAPDPTSSSTLYE